MERRWTTREVDPARPCLACGAPWLVITQHVEVWDAAAFYPDDVQTVFEECLAGCWKAGGPDLARYKAGLEERRRLHLHGG